MPKVLKAIGALALLLAAIWLLVLFVTATQPGSTAAFSDVYPSLSLAVSALFFIAAGRALELLERIADALAPMKSATR